MANIYRNENQVKGAKKQNFFVECLKISAYMYFFTAMFSIFSIVFIGTTIKPWLKIIIGIAFLLPNLFIFYAKARMVASKDFNAKNDTILSNIHEHKFNNLNCFKSILYALPYSLSAILLESIFVLAKIKVLIGIFEILFAPSTLFFIGIGAHHNDANLITWMSVAIVATYVILATIAFVVGYFVSIKKNIEKTQSLIQEIRSYGQ